MNKRLLGWFSWHHKWKSEHQHKVLDALLRHLDEIRPDHICATGDITYTTLPAEVDAAAAWFDRLGDPQRLSLIPGNHDAYVPGALDYALQQWGRWMRDDEGRTGFPFLHRRGPVNIVGLSSAVPAPVAVSWGHLGREQIERTEALLNAVKDEHRPSILMIYHPPQEGAAKRLRALTDRQDLRRMLARSPVDLVLHGHLHYAVRATLDGPEGPIPVLGAASASAIGKRKSVAHYHLIEVELDPGKPQLSVRQAYYDPAAETFTLSGSQPL